MSVWDKTTPAGSDPKSQGDDRLRELKAALEEALQGQAEEGDEAVFPGTSPSTAPVFRYRGLKGATGSRPSSGQYGLYFDTTRNALQRDNGATWEDIATVIPARTVMCFFQATVPTGWTLVTTQNDKVLRVVSGTGGGSGGTIATSTGLAHSHTVDAHYHTHKHLLPVSSGGISVADRDAWGKGYSTTSILHYGVGASGSSASIDLLYSENNLGGETAPGTNSALGVLAYADIILGSKD